MDVLFKNILQSFPFCFVLSDISEPLLQKCAMIFEITFTEITACFSALEVGLPFLQVFRSGRQGFEVRFRHKTRLKSD